MAEYEVECEVSGIAWFYVDADSPAQAAELVREGNGGRPEDIALESFNPVSVGEV